MEDLIANSQGFDEIVDAELALDRDGHVMALRADVIGDVGAYSIYPWTAALEPVQVVSFLPGPYRIAKLSRPGARRRHLESADRTLSRRRPADLDLRHGTADRHGGGQTRHRCQGHPARNLVAADELPYKVASGIVWDKSGFQECLHAACGAIGYDALRAKQKAARAAGRWVGIGVACYAELTGIGSRISVAPGMPINTGTETAIVRIDATGAVTAAFGIASHGQGLETTLAQVVAEHLGVRVEDVRIVQGDSALIAGSTGTYASRSMVLAGGAATLAAQAVREKSSTPPRICSKRLPPIWSPKPAPSRSPAPTVRSASARSPAPSIRKWAGCRRTRATRLPPPGPTIRSSAPRRRRPISPRSRSIRRPTKSASTISPSPRIAAGWSIR